MRDARLRLLGPVDAGLDLPHPTGQRVLALVEPGDVGAGASELALALAEFDVAPHRHPVADVVGEQREPFLIAPLVEDFRLAVEELGDILREQQAGDALVSVTHRAAPPRPSPPRSGRRWETPPRPSPGPAPACKRRTR